MIADKNARGFATLEVVLSLFLLTSGVAAVLWLQQSALLQQRQQLLRHVAIGLAEDLAERMVLNAAHAPLYARSWGQSSATKGVDCVAQPCTLPDLAAWDMQQFQTALNTQLPQGDANVFAPAAYPGWWGIVVAWQDPQQNLPAPDDSLTPACPQHTSCWRLWLHPQR